MTDLGIDELNALRELKTELTRFMMSYKFATDEMMTKINILNEEFSSIHDYNPIEHIRSRLKSPEGILKKALRTGCPLALDEIRDHIQDIAGIRITCSFISDTYRVCDMLSRQQDVTVLKVKDYIASPKPNGYKSLHLLVAVPVFMSDRVQPVTVEIQIRTIAMDFWASLEHKIYYKYGGGVPATLLVDLKRAADVAGRLDVEMERLHEQVVALGIDPDDVDDHVNLDLLSQLPMSSEVLEAFVRGRTGVPTPKMNEGAQSFAATGTSLSRTDSQWWTQNPGGPVGLDANACRTAVRLGALRVVHRDARRARATPADREAPTHNAQQRFASSC